MSAIQTLRNHLEMVQQSFSNALSDSSPQSLQPTHLSTPLFPHQLATLYAMKQKEHDLRNGLLIEKDSIQTRFYSFFSVLGDPSGSGKSLSVLGHISQMAQSDISTPSPTLTFLHPKSLPFCFSIASKTPPSPPFDSLLVVPYTLFHQWKSTIESHTTLSCTYVYSQKDVDKESLIESIQKSHLTLVSSSCFSFFMQKTKEYIWNRVFYDEADILKISGSCPSPQTLFIWFLSCRYPNLLLPNSCYNSFLIRQLPAPFIDSLDPELQLSIQSRIQHHPNVLFFRVVSSTFFKEFVHSTHPLRGYLVIRCKKSFLDSSLSLPPPCESTVLCKSTLSSQSQLVHETLEYLRNSDIQGAVQSMNLSQYPDPIPPSILEESCSICYDSNSPFRCCTPCCSKSFCASCILQWLSKNSTCPLCRSSFSPNSLLLVSPPASPPLPPLPSTPTKFEALLSLVKESPKGKFLIFSRYENTLSLLNESFITLPVTGTSFAIQKTLERFDKGFIKALLLDSKIAAAGLHLHMATHLVIMHKLMPEEYSYIVGRALAPGRTSPLNIIYLYTKNES
jgi:hypothetical protein